MTRVQTKVKLCESLHAYILQFRTVGSNPDKTGPGNTRDKSPGASQSRWNTAGAKTQYRLTGARLQTHLRRSVGRLRRRDRRPRLHLLLYIQYRPVRAHGWQSPSPDCVQVMRPRVYQGCDYDLDSGYDRYRSAIAAVVAGGGDRDVGGCGDVETILRLRRSPRIVSGVFQYS